MNLIRLLLKRWKAEEYEEYTIIIKLGSGYENVPETGMKLGVKSSRRLRKNGTLYLLP